MFKHWNFFLDNAHWQVATEFLAVRGYRKAYNLPTGPTTCELATKCGGTAVFVRPADPLQYKKVIPSVRLCVWDGLSGVQNLGSSWGRTRTGVVQAGINPLPNRVDSIGRIGWGLGQTSVFVKVVVLKPQPTRSSGWVTPHELD